jgi:hypothetical protein
MVHRSIGQALEKQSEKFHPMKAEMHISAPLPAKVLFKLAILGGVLLGGVFGIIQLFMTAVKLLQ